MNMQEFVYRPPSGEPLAMNAIPNAEWAEQFKDGIRIGFISPENVHLYDDDGKEIDLPKCEACKQFMCFVLGKECFKYICMSESCQTQTK